MSSARSHTSGGWPRMDVRLEPAQLFQRGQRIGVRQRSDDAAILGFDPRDLRGVMLNSLPMLSNYYNNL